jgi:hypothetical protein
MVTVKSTRLWRNFLLILAVFSLAIAIGEGYSPAAVFSNSLYLLATVIIVAFGFFAARAIKNLALNILDIEYKPWYGSFFAVLFFISMSAIADIGVYLILWPLFTLDILKVITLSQLMHLLPAVVTFWTILLDPAPSEAGSKPAVNKTRLIQKVDYFIKNKITRTHLNRQQFFTDNFNPNERNTKCHSKQKNR